MDNRDSTHSNPFAQGWGIGTSIGSGTSTSTNTSTNTNTGASTGAGSDSGAGAFAFAYAGLGLGSSSTSSSSSSPGSNLGLGSSLGLGLLPGLAPHAHTHSHSHSHLSDPRTVSVSISSMRDANANANTIAEDITSLNLSPHPPHMNMNMDFNTNAHSHNLNLPLPHHTNTDSPAFGALPSFAGFPPHVRDQVATFVFVNPNPNILQCTIVRRDHDNALGDAELLLDGHPHAHTHAHAHAHGSPTSSLVPCYQVITEGPGSIPGYTTIKSVGGTSVALIEWGRLASSLPNVEIRNTLMKVPVGEWLQLKVNRLTGRTSRLMKISGVPYIWMSNSDALHLYPATTTGSQPFVIVQKRGMTVNVELTPEAMSRHLLEPCLVAIALLLCGRKLE